MYEAKFDDNLISLIDKLPTDILKSLLMLYARKSEKPKYIYDSYFLYGTDSAQAKTDLIIDNLNEQIENFTYEFIKDEKTGKYFNTGEYLAAHIYKALKYLCNIPDIDDSLSFHAITLVYEDALSLDFEDDYKITEKLQADWLSLMEHNFHYLDFKLFRTFSNYIKAPYTHCDVIIKNLITKILKPSCPYVNFKELIVGLKASGNYQFLNEIQNLLNYLLKIEGPWTFDKNLLHSIYDASIVFIEKTSDDSETDILNFHEKWKAYDFIEEEYEYLKLENALSAKVYTEALEAALHLLEIVTDEKDRALLYLDIAECHSNLGDMVKAKQALRSYLSYDGYLEPEYISNTKGLIPLSEWILLLENKQILETHKNEIAETFENENLPSNLFALCEKFPDMKIFQEHSYYLATQDMDRYIDLLNSLLDDQEEHDMDEMLEYLDTLFKHLIHKGFSTNKLKYILQAIQKQKADNSNILDWIMNFLKQTSLNL